MLISATIGFFFNLYNGKLMLERGTVYSRKLLNSQAVANSNLIMSITVLLISFLVFFVPDYWIVDPLYTFFFGVMVMIQIKPICINCLNVLMEGTPLEFETEKLY